MAQSDAESAASVERSGAGRQVRLLALRWTAGRPGSEWWLGALVAVGLMIGTRLAEDFSGPLKTPHPSFEAGLPYTLAIALGYIVAAYSYAIRRCEQDFDALRPSLRCSEPEFRRMRDSLSHHDRRLVPAAGVAAVLLIIVIQQALAERFTRFFVSGDWNLLRPLHVAATRLLAGGRNGRTPSRPPAGSLRRTRRGVSFARPHALARIVCGGAPAPRGGRAGYRPSRGGSGASGDGGPTGFAVARGSPRRSVARLRPSR